MAEDHRISDVEPDHFADVVHMLADVARDIIQSHQGKGQIRKIYKKDGQGRVTEADIRAGEAMVSFTLKNLSFSCCSIYGEETG